MSELPEMSQGNSDKDKDLIFCALQIVEECCKIWLYSTLISFLSTLAKIYSVTLLYITE